ncbi:MAG: FkbM family methyltransferase [Bacteroidales bacterium]|nr:FkbM family methyltransferase [Bacteroidales bacterium]
MKFNPQFAYHYFVKNLIRKGDVIIDIGANLGYYSILFARWVGPSGKVLSVEPIPVYNKIFQEKAKKYKKIVLYPYALGSEEKTVELVSSTRGGYLRTGLSHIYNAEKDGLIDQQGFKVEAHMKMASELFKNLDRLDYIKCDIEGDEYTVLSDMEEIIRKYKPVIQVEVNDEKISPFLNGLGYQSYKLHKNRLIREEPNKPLKGDYIFRV